jgi:CheY-like chemotaxis protein
VSEQLTAEGFAVTAVASGAQGLSAVAAGAFDLILLDMHPPEQDGLKTYLILRTHLATRHTPVILVTDTAPPDYWAAVPTDTEGPCFVMGKTCEASTLRARMTQLLAQAVTSSG